MSDLNPFAPKDALGRVIDTSLRDMERRIIVEIKKLREEVQELKLELLK
jgi:hypothetical protein